MTVDSNSDEFLKLAKALLSSDKHRKFNVSRFSRKEAAQLIDVIDVGVSRDLQVHRHLTILVLDLAE